MANSGFSLPSGFGGLVNYGEEYASKFNLTPTHVIAFVIFIIAIRIGLEFLY